jgi:hypothetical protein
MVRLFLIGALLALASAAQAQFNGCGSGPCSGQTLVASSPPVSDAPAPAKAWGYTKLAFDEQWNDQSGIDWAGTEAPGFRWYTILYFPDALGGTSGDLGFFANPISNTSWLIGGAAGAPVSNHVMGPLDGGLATCTSSPSDHSVLVGQSFNSGFYIEGQMKFITMGGNAASYWFFSGQAATGHVDGGSTHWAEPDVENQFGSSASGYVSMFVHDHSNGGDNGFWNQYTCCYVNGYDGNLHHYGTLVVPSYRNNGVGLIQRFVDDVGVGETQFSPNITTDGILGALTGSDAEQFCLMLQSYMTASGSVTYFGPIQIWVAPRWMSAMLDRYERKAVLRAELERLIADYYGTGGEGADKSSTCCISVLTT